MINDSINYINTNSPIESVPYGVSVIPKNRLDYLENKCREALIKSPGNILEVGVYKGGSLMRLNNVIHEICPQYEVFGIDTFSGHPYTDGHPVHPKGKYNDVTLEKLNAYLKQFSNTEGVKLYKGLVEDILDKLDLSNISFAHIDCDLYIPTKYCVQVVPKMMNKNGLIYFDDYGHEHCPGATRAIEEVYMKDILNMVHIPEDKTCWSCFIEIN